jgi:hypothetical protein
MRDLIREYGVKGCLVALAQTVIAGFCIYALLVVLLALGA